MTRSIWSDDERAVLWLRKLYGTKSAKEISSILSKEFGVTISRNAVIGKLGRLGLTRENTQQADRVTRGPRALRKPRAPRPARNPVLRIVNSSWGHQKIIETITGELPTLTCAPIESRHVLLADLKINDCRFPSDCDGGTTYCGHDIFKRSFCAVHFHLAYRPWEPRRVA